MGHAVLSLQSVLILLAAAVLAVMASRALRLPAMLDRIISAAVELVEALEDDFQVRRGDPDTGVRDLEDDAALRGARHDGDRARVRELAGVGDQVRQDLLQLLAVQGYGLLEAGVDLHDEAYRREARRQSLRASKRDAAEDDGFWTALAEARGA